MKMRAAMLSVALAGAALLVPRTFNFKNIGLKLGLYHEAFPAFGKCEPPEFDRSHF